MVESSEQDTVAHRLGSSPLDGCVRERGVAGGCALQSRVQLSQTSCYLCSAWLDDKDVEEHLRVCREQKIVCPNGCGSFVARKTLQLHSNRCPQSFDDTAPTDRCAMNPPGSNRAPNDHAGTAASCFPAYQRLQQEIDALKQAVAEQSVKYSAAMRKIDQLRKLIDQSGAGPSHMHQTQHQPLPPFQSLPQNQLQRLPQPGPSGCVGLSAPEQRPSSALVFGQEQLDVAKLQYSVKDTQVRQYEQEERHNQLSDKVKRYREENLYTKRRLDELTPLVSRMPVKEKTGRILWFVDNVAARWKEAKEHSHTMNGQIYCSNVLGYVVQMNLSLDGINEYRGTHMSVTVTVSPGPYGRMLDWPMQAHVTMKVYDQNPTRAEAEDFVIEHTVQEASQPATFHFSHTSLARRHFIVRDTLVLCADIVLDRYTAPQPAAPRTENAPDGPDKSDAKMPARPWSP